MENKEAFNFDSLFRESYDALCYFSYQYLSEENIAEDLVQDAFFQLYNKRAAFLNAAAAKAFLYTCIRNAALNRIRHQKVHDKFISRRDNHLQNEDRIFEDIIKAEVLSAINHAIESLPEKCRRIFKMGYIDELKNHEIADQLGITINTVKTQKKRAFQLLRIKLNEISPAICSMILLTSLVQK